VPNLKFVSLVILELLPFNAQKCKRSRDPGHDPVIFVVDESGGVGSSNFELVKSFLSQLIVRLDIDNGNTRVGLVKYSDDVDTAQAFNLNAYSSVASVQSAVSSLVYNGVEGSRRDFPCEQACQIRSSYLQPF